MKVIEIHHPYQREQIPFEDVVLVLGFFDGVHSGHQEVIRQGKKMATEKGLKLAVMTFNHHPSIVFQKINPEQMKYLTTIEQKERRMANLGVDYLYIIEFTSSFASLAPQDFVDQYMIQLNAKVVVAGFDYTYGPEETANMTVLPEYIKGRAEIVTVAKQTAGSEKISSTAIREAMATGDMEKVAGYLGYVYEIEGTVVHGDARGRTLGFPTANIKVDLAARLPRKGVYAVRIKVADTWYRGMAQIGRNITFEPGRDITVEVNILDFKQDIYGERVSVEWCHYLRDEVKFTGVDGLIAQLKQDQLDTEDYFKQN